MPQRLIIGISGASGVIYGIRLLEVLRGVAEIETHLVVSGAARQTIALETDYSIAAVEALADVTYRINDIAAAISSGSYPTIGMAVVPCSMKTLAGIALSLSDNLLLRAADVTLKERRRLIIVARETPLHLGHLRLMTQVTELGGVIMPPMPAFYNRPRDIDELVSATVARVLDRLDLPHTLAPEWQGTHPRVTSEHRRA